MLMQALPMALLPRERMLAMGPESLSEVELLALLLRTGTTGKTVIDLAQDLLDRFGGLVGLLYAEPKDLEPIKGMGPAKRCEIMAVVELMRRLLAIQVKEAPIFHQSQIIKDYLQLHLSHLPREVFVVLFLDPNRRLLAMEELFQGTIHQTRIHPREVVSRALHHRATHVILAHNHPHGSTTSSGGDIDVTHTLRQVLELIEVKVLDHFIVGPGFVTSMRHEYPAVFFDLAHVPVSGRAC